MRLTTYMPPGPRLRMGGYAVLTLNPYAFLTCGAQLYLSISPIICGPAKVYIPLAVKCCIKYRKVMQALSVFILSEPCIV
jgi:hypothetical protein